jgi:dolichyl-phosphate beta-glucosyltransferase
MKAQLLLEVLLTFLTLVVLPAGVCLLFEPCYKYYTNSKIDKGIRADTYIVRGQECKGQCRVGELREKASVDLSIVIPAFNEEERLPLMMDDALAYFKKYARMNALSYEVLVVDDYSTDGTVDLVQKYVRNEIAAAEAASDCEGGECKVSDMDKASSYTDIRILSLARNHGKGGAVRRGVLFARGKYILFADADGATDIKEFDKLFNNLVSIETPSTAFRGNSVGAAFGSRAHLEEESIAKRTFVRTLLMHGFHMFVSVFVTDQVKDTQCGFKLFTRYAAKFLFANLHLEGWAFDIELIYLAEQYHIPMKEVGVVWTEVAGSKLIQSKVDLVKASVFMARDILCVRMAYMTHIWRAVTV